MNIAMQDVAIWWSKRTAVIHTSYAACRYAGEEWQQCISAFHLLSWRCTVMSWYGWLLFHLWCVDVSKSNKRIYIYIFFINNNFVHNNTYIIIIQLYWWMMKERYNLCSHFVTYNYEKQIVKRSEYIYFDM